MTFKQLEYFVAIADLGNITAASRVLNIAQPPLSYQLKTLEEELGVSLFTRSGKSLKITQEGIILHRKAMEVLSILNSAIREIQQLGKEESQTINIGTITSVSSRILPRKIQSFSQKHHNVDYQLWEGNSFRIMEMIDEGAVDIGFVREPIDKSRYNSKQVIDDALDADQTDFFVAMGKKDRFMMEEGESINLNDLKDVPLIIHRRYESILINACRQKGFFPNVVCRNDEITSSISWAEQGIGVSIMPYTSSTIASTPCSSLTIKKITEPSINSKVLLIWKKDNSISNIAVSFIESF